jgi:hypothetical protein
LEYAEKPARKNLVPGARGRSRLTADGAGSPGVSRTRELARTGRNVRNKSGERRLCGSILTESASTKEDKMGRGILLWLLGVPIPIIILIALLYH